MQTAVIVLDDAAEGALEAFRTYTIFGRVVEGMDVVEKIKQVDTTNKAGHSDVPAEPIVIEKAEISG